MKYVCKLAVFALFALAGCATDSSYEAVNRLLADVPPEQGLAKLEKAVKENPRNSTYRAALLRERERVAAARLREGDSALRAGRLDDARAAYRQAGEADPDGYGANAGLKDVERARRHGVLIEEAQTLVKAGDLGGAETRLRTVLSENPYQPQARELLRRVVESAFAAEPMPKLKSPYKKPITLEFRDTQLRTVFEMLSRTSGINFVFDRDVKQDTKVTIYVRNSNLEDIMKLVFTTNQLDAKVLNDNSVLIYPNTPAKQKDYRELVVRSFYLANADVKQASAMVKSMVKTQDVFIDEKLNLMVVKDTPDVVRLTEQLVRTLDIAEPEVMLEVEVIEVTRSRLQDLGIGYPGSVQFGAKNIASTTAGALVPFNTDRIFKITDPALTFNLRATVGTTNLLANPRIRVRNKEKARIHIGDKVPQFTTTAAVNIGVATSVSYIDVGLKLDIEAQVYLNDEVGIKVGLEVSNIVEQITTNNAVAYRLGTRNTNTVLQLRDGETQVLAGLINDEDRRSAQRIPGLGDLPLLSRIFGTQQDNRLKNEIMLLITPRIVRNISRPEGVMAEMPVGTDSFPGMPPLRIAKTAAGTLAMTPGGGGTNSVIPMPTEDVMTATAPVLGLAAPASARSTSEFDVTVRMPSGGQIRAGQVELSYDAKALAPVGIKPLSPGRVGMELAGGASKAVRFKVLAAEAGNTLIAISAADLVDESGFAIGVEVPPPASVAITP